MPSAKTIEDLLIIRNHNTDLLERFNAGWGSALGRKKGTGEPCVLVFVPEKVNARWVINRQLVPPMLSEPGGLNCPTEVVQATGYQSAKIPPTITGENLNLRDDLWGGSPKLMLGSQLAFFNAAGKRFFGTLGCFVTDEYGALGILTNAHIGDYLGNVLKHPYHTYQPIALVDIIENDIKDEFRFPGIVNEKYAYYTIDAAFARLLPDIDPAGDMDTHLSYIDLLGKRVKSKLGNPYNLDLKSMDPIGKKVLGVGRSRSCQRGEIFAFAYEWLDEGGESMYTDYLIGNEDGQQFSEPGDSGKLIVTDDGNFQPIALLWGGSPSRLQVGSQKEDWTYAIDINIILDRLNLTIKT